MATDGRSDSIIDTSVLVNFLKIDRTDLLALHPLFRFLVIDYVGNEITKYYAAQVARLEASLLAGQLIRDQPSESTSPLELATYAALTNLKIGQGEMAAIAAAYARGVPLAMDDEQAWRRSSAFSSSLQREGTASLMVALIRSGTISVTEADLIKVDWQTNHRFTLLFQTFAELV